MVLSVAMQQVVRKRGIVTPRRNWGSPAQVAIEQLHEALLLITDTKEIMRRAEAQFIDSSQGMLPCGLERGHVSFRNLPDFDLTRFEPKWLF
jgi:hypothetical protein